MKLIEKENRLATEEEKEILSKYVGWGGISQAFDADNSKWTKEYQELKELLTDDEYISARRTTLSSFYTSPAIIKAIYEAIQQSGLETEKILEPSCGIGNFFGLLPKEMEQSKLYGIELDSITGGIAKQLYPNANIKISGYQGINYPNNFFDTAIGNIPFGNYKVFDSNYQKLNFYIHDYFFAKTIDKVKPNGMIAFITSKGFLDKQDTKARKYIAQRANLIGAIRLPNNAFKENAGTDVTSDIVFLQKRETLLESEIEPDWVNIGKIAQGIPLNQYFLKHHEMILGKMEFSQNMYGGENDTACIPFENADLSEQLKLAVEHLEFTKLQPLEIDNAIEDTDDIDNTEEQVEGCIEIPEDTNIKNFSYTMIDEKLYFREGQFFTPVNNIKEKDIARVEQLIELRDITHQLINAQVNNNSDEEIKNLQQQLNQTYDKFINKYGIIHNSQNKKVFQNDSAYPLLCSLESLDESKKKLEKKADIFFKRTIKPHVPVTHVETANEALSISMAEKACVDLNYMADLMGGSENIEKIKEDLRGIIFQNPISEKWETADEYLSGNVREKLKIAREAAEKNPIYNINIEKLKQIQPKDLNAIEIDVRIGASWIDLKYYQQFMYETFKTDRYYRIEGDRECISLEYSEHTNRWYINNKHIEKNNLITSKTYGTDYCHGYELLEKTLNLQNAAVTIKKADKSIDYKKSEEETTIVQQKQEMLQEEFKNWIWKDPERRNELCKKYNELFNNFRPREYDGSYLNFQGMNIEYNLKPHQKNAAAHMILGNNALLAHATGAGKTFAMIAATMELKRLGLIQKAMFVVPNHLIEQWGADFRTLYPSSNVLVSTKKDFEKQNRRKFCSRIATGDYDAVIIGHTQFNKIPISPEREEQILQERIDEVIDAIEEAKDEGMGRSYNVKQMEKKKISMQERLKKLANRDKKDDTIYFEQLGIDRLFVDEAHEFKNLGVETKMQNVAGINTTSSQKANDLYMKCRYIDEITSGKGTVFATATPISNSMTELYIMMKYLQYNTLQKLDLLHFDNWATCFGEKKTGMELKPEGTGFRLKTRFSKFFNLPELIQIWKECADIQTSDMLDLDVPKADYINVVTKPSEYQKAMVQDLAERAEKVRNREVDRNIDNMLVITNDGRKLALDQRIINPLLPDNPDSKVNTCVENIFDNWIDSKENLGTQLVFCDMSTPKGKKESNKKSTNNENIDTDEVIEEDTESDKLESNLYEDMKNKLIKKGIPKNEIAFIHDADTEAKKEKLFADVRNGKVRVLLGSRRKMGAGMNVQDRLMAIHHLDPPWRPGDLEQADGRGIRQGNENEIVKIYRYVTEGTFDAYSWAILENKQKFISQIMTSKTPVRSCEDVDATELSYAEVKALATGDTRIKDIMTLETEIAKLKILKSNFYSQKYEMEDKLIKYYPIRIQEKRKQLKSLSADLEHFKKYFNEDFKMEIFNTIYEKRPEAGEKILALCKKLNYGQELAIGKYKGFSMSLTTGNLFDDPYRIILKNRHTYYTKLGNDAVGNIRRIQNTLEEIPQIMKRIENKISELEKQVSFDTEEVKKEFPQEKELEEKTNRLIVLKSEIESKEKEEQDNTQEIEKTENNIIDVDGKEITDIKKEEKPSILGKLNTLKKEVKEINKEIQTSAHKKEEVTL